MEMKLRGYVRIMMGRLKGDCWIERLRGEGGNSLYEGDVEDILLCDDAWIIAFVEKIYFMDCDCFRSLMSFGNAYPIRRLRLWNYGLARGTNGCRNQFRNHVVISFEM